MRPDPFSSKFKHLRGAMRLTGPRGMCFHRASGLVLDLPPATLAVGTLPAALSEQQHRNPDLSKVDFIHAWVEVKDVVYAPTLIERSMQMGTPWIFPKEEYYEANSPRNIRTMTRARLKRLSIQFGIANHLVKQVPLLHEMKFGDIILNELKIPFVVTEKGGVIPAPVERE